MPTYFRSDQARVQVNVSGVSMPSDSWSKMEGGDNTAETYQLLPGGMSPAVAQGGLAKRGVLTVQRPWSDVLVGLYKQLDQASGSAQVTASYVVLDVNKNPVPGGTITFNGVLKSVTRPNYDSTTSTEGLLQITVELDEQIT